MHIHQITLVDLLCIMYVQAQILFFTSYLERLGDNSTIVNTIEELTVGHDGQCVIKEDETQRGWYTPTGPGFSGNISLHIRPFNYDLKKYRL